MKKRIHIFIFFLLALLSANTWAQDGLTVKRFSDVSQSKLYARSADAPKDNMGNQPALLLVQVLSDSEASFSANYMIASEKRGNEYWVYMAEGAKYLEVSLPRYEKIRVVFNEVSHGSIPSLVSKCTYELVINVPGAIPTTHTPNRQYFKFFVQPADANVRVLVDGDWQWWLAEDGLASKSLDYGTYEYEVSYDRYRSEHGFITVSQNSQQLEVKLRPMFGWLNITCEEHAVGAYVFATNLQTSTPVRLGQLPLENKELESGTYRIEIQKDKFKDFKTTIVVSDGDTTVLQPLIEGNSGHVTLQAGDGVEIYLDGRLLGANVWKGTLECGAHEIEARKENHHSTYTRIDVMLQEEMQTFTLNQPTPKYGALAIEGKPFMSTVYIDGKVVGTTPILVDKLLFGEHTIRIEKEGYQSYKQKLVINDEKEQLVRYTLTKQDGASNAKKPAVEPAPKAEPKPVVEKTPVQKEKPVKEPKPAKTPSEPKELRMNTFVLANAGSSLKDQLWGAGAMFGQLYNGYGWYVKGRSNFQAAQQTVGSCDKNLVANGMVDGLAVNGVKPFYSGKAMGSQWVANIGFAMDFLGNKEKKNKNNFFGLYVGAGYGSVQYALETNTGYWLTYTPWSATGLSIDAGIIGSIGGFTVAAGVNVLGFKHIEAEVSIGWTF